MGIFYPPSLEKGDKIAFISPAYAVKDDFVFGAMERFIERGYQPVLMPNALKHESGTFAASTSERLMDLLEALEDPSYKAIFCNRGGYGCAQLLANFPSGLVTRNPKWIVGFSDVSALLALWYCSGIVSVHGPMAKHLATMPPDDPCTEALFSSLENGGRFDYTVPPHTYNRVGKATGILRGGNLAVLNDLSATPYDIMDPDNEKNEDVIIFLEDIAEPIYKVNRMLYRLLLSGTLKRVKGIIFGQFTEYRPDKNYSSMEDMIREMLRKYLSYRNIPIAYDFPVGHADLNYPLTVGAKVELEVSLTSVNLHSIY